MTLKSTAAGIYADMMATLINLSANSMIELVGNAVHMGSWCLAVSCTAGRCLQATVILLNPSRIEFEEIN
jgi:hypothetical protein